MTDDIHRYTANQRTQLLRHPSSLNVLPASAAADDDDADKVDEGLALGLYGV